ncbi:metallopeptidase TldD-related protein, partial [Alphaproteobacteria bacterium]|nr:metallopeptidase TldD-related protein [Alphaproteobacteria bacterium]
EASNTVSSVKSGYEGQKVIDPVKTNNKLYTDKNPLSNIDFSKKVRLLESINEYSRGLDKRVSQLAVNLSGSWQKINIFRPSGQKLYDIRPLVRLNISITLEDNGKKETGSVGLGGRYAYDDLFDEKVWKNQVHEAIAQANTMLKAIPAPAGEQTVVLGPGWPGILLHEAIGHGLEGDFNRKKISVFTELMGSMVANPEVNVYDDGTIPNRRGSFTIDDEGTPSQKTTLIENGKLVGYMQDRQNARLMNTSATGNGRRQSYAHQPMPRMSNTIMANGKHNPEEILKGTKKGIYAKTFGGGQVDITNGKFVFSASEAYLIENGKITKPIKGATLIGSGFEVLKKVEFVGNDLKMDPGIGTCGKNGQGVPVGVGQPTLKINGLTVGGTGN